MPPIVRSKLPDVGTTIFTVMSARAAEVGAINLSQGFPDFAVPEALREALARHVHAGQNQYAPMAGVLALREQVAGGAWTRWTRSLWCPALPRRSSARSWRA
jgi:methionine aminotransferase